MIGDNCKTHLATRIRGREPLLCARWVPGFAIACTDCGAVSPRVRLDRFVRHFERAAGQGGNIDKTVERMTRGIDRIRSYT